MLFAPRSLERRGASASGGPASPGPRFAAALALAGTLAGMPAAIPAAAADSRLPDLGGGSGETLGRAEEERLGEAFLRQIRGHLRLVDDPEAVDYIDALGQRIASADPERRYRFLLVDSPSVNAFAGPGGVIAVNAGLVAVTESESELAAVVAHEVAHVALEHLAQLMARNRRTSLAALASVVAGIVLATQSPSAGQTVLAAGTAGAQHSVLRYSREKEMEADRTSMELLHRAGFDPRAVPAFFQRFHEWRRFAGSPPEFLSTHPATLSRIADTLGRAEQYEPRAYRESADYPLVRAKLQVMLADKPESALARFEARVRAGGPDPAEADRYGLAIALMGADRHEEASAVLEALRRDFPERAAHRAAAAEAYSALGEEARALDLLAASVDRFPDHRALVYGYGFALVRAGRAEDATVLLRRFQRAHETDATVHRLLGLAHQRAGRAAASHMALAEFHYHNGDLASAIRQLDIALDDPAIDDYRAARATARRKQLRDERAAYR